jgi:hypothetical protein
MFMALTPFLFPMCWGGMAAHSHLPKNFPYDSVRKQVVEQTYVSYPPVLGNKGVEMETAPSLFLWKAAFYQIKRLVKRYME